MTLKRTPLFAAHQKLGARLVEFGGWEMPVQYTSIMDEHQAVRTAAGLFDISHMGEVWVIGAEAVNFLNATLTNNAAKLAPGQAQYSLLCNERGGVVDDLYLYCVGKETFLLIINASRIEADMECLRARHAAFARCEGVLVTNVSSEYGAVALQGPRVAEFIDQCFTGNGTINAARPAHLKKNELDIFNFGGRDVFVARTGYTGEDGFEIVTSEDTIEAVWDRVLEIGRPFGIKPTGLGARDTLRTEACLPLYGHELDENTTPIEAGLGFFVALDKGDFTGRALLADQKAMGVARKCVAFKMTDKSAPPRPHYPIWSTGPDAKKIGEAASGTQSPSLSIGIGLGYVPTEFSQPDTLIEIEIRGRRSPAVVVRKPIYKKTT
ncbi:MAG: glycine cleavage system aminomethyltransferase GcvT [Pedosphaera sp.]|nr:glycine cleavage system aminomethyltransferase GcvT [Pedosphaera sp.]